MKVDGLTIQAPRDEDAAVIAAIYNEAVLHTTATFDLDPESVDARRRWLADEDTKAMSLAVVDEVVVGWAALVLPRTARASVWLSARRPSKPPAIWACTSSSHRSARRTRVISRSPGGSQWLVWRARTATESRETSPCHKKNASMLGDIQANTPITPTQRRVANMLCAPLSQTCRCKP